MSALATPPLASPVVAPPLGTAGAGVDAALARLARAERRSGLLRWAAQVALLVLVAAALLVAIDLAYHFGRGARVALDGAALASVIGVAIVLALRVRRPLSSAALALALERHVPSLQGLAVAAAGIRQGTPGDASPEAELLRLALLEEAERALAAIDPAAAVDRSAVTRWGHRCGLTAAALAVLIGIAPARLGHAAARALTPWRTLPPTAAELAAAARAQALAAQAQALAQAAAAAAAAARAPITISVTPGAAQVVRGQGLAIEARVSRVQGEAQLRVRLSNGRWRTLTMDSAPDDPARLNAVVSDIDADCAYQVAMGPSQSEIYPITVYDLTEATDVHAAIRAPAYAEQPTRTTKGLDVEGLVAAHATVSITANGALGRVLCTLDDGTAVPVQVHGKEAAFELTLVQDGGYHLTAEDIHHHPLQGLPEHASIHALVDQPPTIALLYPSIDTSVHPLEVVPVAAQVTDDVGLKEVRMIWRYGLEDPVTERRSCRLKGVALKDLAGQFILDIKHHPTIHQGDCIVFHLEAEDLKGQRATTDPFLITVRGYELMASYASGNVGAGHNGQNSANYTTILGALHDLAARKDSLTPAQYRAECAHIADLYTFIPYAH